MQATVSPRFLSCGDTSLAIEFGEQVDRDLSALVLALAQRITDCGIDGVIETVPTFRSLMIHYDPLRVRRVDLELRLAEMLRDLRPGEATRRLWRIPACYDPALGPDLEEVAGRTGLTMAEVVELHSSTLFHVYMLGFLPGYPYMGDLPAELALPRRENPRIKVPPGSLAIAMTMAAIYSLESPGGWHLLGRTPVPIWDHRRETPALLMPGDKVRFEPISLREYDALSAEAEAGTLSLTCEPYVPGAET